MAYLQVTLTRAADRRRVPLLALLGSWSALEARARRLMPSARELPPDGLQRMMTADEALPWGDVSLVLTEEVR